MRKKVPSIPFHKAHKVPSVSPIFHHFDCLDVQESEGKKWLPWGTFPSLSDSKVPQLWQKAQATVVWLDAATHNKRVKGPDVLHCTPEFCPSALVSRHAGQKLDSGTVLLRPREVVL